MGPVLCVYAELCLGSLAVQDLPTALFINYYLCCLLHNIGAGGRLQLSAVNPANLRLTCCSLHIDSRGLKQAENRPKQAKAGPNWMILNVKKGFKSRTCLL